MIRAMIALFKAFAQAFRNPQYQLLALTMVLVLGGGTAFYHYYENWTWIDSLYFVVVALTTVGFGDFAPSTELSRVVTIFFVLFGVALLGAFISLVMKGAQQKHQAKVRAQQADDS